MIEILRKDLKTTVNYSFLNKKYKLKFKYFRLEIRKVNISVMSNKLEINKNTKKEKCQSMPKKYFIKK